MTEEESEPRWSREEQRALQLALDERRTRAARGGRIIAGVLVSIVAAGVLLRLPPDWWVPAVGFVALAGLVFLFVGWTCPACGERLPTRRSSQACPGCGLPLD
jgi:hypothetical protein